jgi:hypothetical protein
LHDAAPVQGVAVQPECRKLDPAEVRPEAGAPYDGRDFRLPASAFEQRQAVAHADRPARALEIPVREGFRRHADERVSREEPALHQPTAKGAVNRRAHERRP